jgi:hypothetical protein
MGFSAGTRRGARGVAIGALAIGALAIEAGSGPPRALAQPGPRAAPSDRKAAAVAPPGLLERTDALAKEISALRGLPVKAPIAKEFVDRAELRRRLIAMTTRPKEVAQLERESTLTKHWGMVPRQLDYAAVLLDVLTAQIAGYYDDETKKLTLTDNPELDPEWSELVLVHEIEHALQDQSFALAKFRDLPVGEDDAVAARTALVEGDGVAVMFDVMAMRGGQPMPWENAKATQRVAEALAESTEPEMEGVPLVLREQLAFPYNAGFAFVAALRQQQPWRAIDAAFRRPPLSTEQILHPQLYAQNEAPLPVSKLGLPAPLLAKLRGPARAAATGSTTGSTTGAAVETVWGELGFSLFLRSHGVNASTAAAAAAGWGGDRVTVIPLGPSGAGLDELGVARLRWDSEADAREAYDALVWAIDAWLLAAMLEQTDQRTRWLDLGGRLSGVERRDRTIVITHNAPLRAVLALDEELWRATPALPASGGKPR